MIELLCYEPGIYAVDAGYLRPQLAAIYLLVEGGRVAVVDTATNACLPRVLDALRSLGLPLTRVDYVFLTHVHLDHAGGAGAMMQTFPEARLVVHPRGVRHMADPAPLFAAVQAVYGADAAEQLYGELVPVPVERILAAGDGHTLDLGGRTLVCLDTPGHARHHLSLLDTHSGGLFAGEAFGISLRELDVDGRASILPAIAPTQFDPAAMQASVGRILALQAARAVPRPLRPDSGRTAPGRRSAAPDRGAGGAGRARAGLWFGARRAPPGRLVGAGERRGRAPGLAAGGRLAPRRAGRVSRPQCPSPGRLAGADCAEAIRTMNFDELDRRLRVFETAHDHCALPGLYLVARLDGRGFGQLVAPQSKA